MYRVCPRPPLPEAAPLLPLYYRTLVLRQFTGWSELWMDLQGACVEEGAPGPEGHFRVAAGGGGVRGPSRLPPC